MTCEGEAKKMDRFDTRSIGAMAGVTLISAILIFKF